MRGCFGRRVRGRGLWWFLKVCHEGLDFGSSRN